MCSECDWRAKSTWRTRNGDAKPVFFGHYWLPGPPVLELPNALCLDFSAGKDGPLAACRMDQGDDGLKSERLVEGEVRA